MSYPTVGRFNKRYYSVATTSSSGAPVSTVIIAARCKYAGGYFVPNNTGTGTNVTGFDVLAFLGGATSGTVISSGTSVTTTTGTLATAINVNGPNVVYLNAGDVITTVASTSQAGFVTHYVHEF